MLDPTLRFSSRVENYVKYRPGYPREVLDILREGCGLTGEWRIADIGSGTGLLTELFLGNGNLVHGIEPNREMREAGEAALRSYSNFRSIDGTAERTTLADSCVEMVTAGQAFHWFDREKAKREFRRILIPGGWVVLIWNDRRTDSPLLNSVDDMLRRLAPDYRMVDHRNVDRQALDAFFSPHGFKTRACHNSQTFDLEGLKGRLLSTSYVPEPGQPGYEHMMAEIGHLFNKYEQDGRVVFEYDTRIHFAHL